MIKKLCSLFLVVSILVGIIVGCKNIKKNEQKPSMYMAIGDSLLVYSSYGNRVYEGLKDKKIDSYSDIVKRSSLDSESLLRFIGVKATIIKEKENQNIVDLIKKSKYITIQIGQTDLNSNLRFNSVEEKFYYNVNVIERAVAQVQENIYNIVNEIKQINKSVKIYVIGYYFPYPSINENEKVIGLEIYGQLNEALRLGAYDSDAKFIEISDLSDVKYLPNKSNTILNEEGIEQLSKIILSEIE